MPAYHASLSWGGDVPSAEHEVIVSYQVAWAKLTADSEISRLEILKIDGQLPENFHEHTRICIIDKLLDEHFDKMLELAL